MNNTKRPKKIIFIKDSKTGAMKQAMDMELFLKQRQQGRIGGSSYKESSSPFLLGIPQSQKTQYKKNCCGRKS